MSGARPEAGGEFPNLDSLDALRADWVDDPRLTERHRDLLDAIPEHLVQETLTRQARQVEGEFYALLDGVRSDATRELLRLHHIDIDD